MCSEDPGALSMYDPVENPGKSPKSSAKKASESTIGSTPLHFYGGNGESCEELAENIDSQLGRVSDSLRNEH